MRPHPNRGKTVRSKLNLELTDRGRLRLRRTTHKPPPYQPTEGAHPMSPFWVVDLTPTGEIRLRQDYEYQFLEKIPNAVDLITAFSTHLWRETAQFDILLPGGRLNLRWRACADTAGIATLRLTDFKVHIIDSHHSTEAVTRVLIESAAGEFSWWTVGTSPNIIEASLMALVDSYEYWFLQFQK